MIREGNERALVSVYLQAGEVRDTRSADEVCDGFARVLDGAHELLQVLQNEGRTSNEETRTRGDRGGKKVLL